MRAGTAEVGSVQARGEACGASSRRAVLLRCSERMRTPAIHSVTSISDMKVASKPCISSTDCPPLVALPLLVALPPPVALLLATPPPHMPRQPSVWMAWSA